MAESDGSAYLKIVVVKIGKPANQVYQVLVDEYLKRLSSYSKYQQKIIPAKGGVEKSTKSTLDFLDSFRGSKLVGLDEGGQNWSSPQFAKKIQEWKDDPSIQSLVFIVGGPYGLTDPIRKRLDVTWSLGLGVYPSDIAWLMLSEQIYRAHTILAGSPYHHV